MRTNIDIDDDLMEAAMRAGPFKTKKEAVEAGLRLLRRQAAYREILKWEGKLSWEDVEAKAQAETTSYPPTASGTSLQTGEGVAPQRAAETQPSAKSGKGRRDGGR